MSSKSPCRAIKITFGVCVVIVACIWAAGRFGPIRPVTTNSGFREIMGTFVQVAAVAGDSGTTKRCIDAAFEQLELVDNLMSDYKDDSEISQVNRDGYKQAVKVSRMVFEVLHRSIEFSKKTAGAFDVTIGPLVDLWRSVDEKNAMPSEEELAEARAKVGFEKLILDEQEQTIRFAVDGMRLDLGGIAKGYAIDLAIEAMQRAGAVGGMVDVGGDIRCFGAGPKGKEEWTIGLQDPGIATEAIIGGPLTLILELTDDAVATSGNYRRFVLIDGKKYSHIINPATSAGTEGLSSVTVIAKNAMDADVLATAVTVMGAEKGLALIEPMPETEAILITAGPEPEQIQTSGADKYIRK